MPELVLGPVIVDGESDVVFAHKLFDARESCWGGVTGDYDGNPCPLAVLEFVANVGVFIFIEINCSGSMEFYACSGVVRQCSGLFRRGRREMIFNVFEIYGGKVELLHEAD